MSCAKLNDAEDIEKYTVCFASSSAVTFDIEGLNPIGIAAVLLLKSINLGIWYWRNKSARFPYNIIIPGVQMPYKIADIAPMTVKIISDHDANEN